MSVFTNPAGGSVEHARAYTEAILDLVGDQDPLAVLSRTPEELRTRVGAVERERRTVPESPGKWSIRHVLQHLADSEIVGSFRFRTALAQDRPPLPGYDQDAWAERLGYDEVEAEEALAHFEVLRAANLRLLRRASADDLRRVGMHAERGAETVAHMMRMYAGHDLLHLRQIDRIRAAVAR